MLRELRNKHDRFKFRHFNNYVMKDNIRNSNVLISEDVIVFEGQNEKCPEVVMFTRIDVAERGKLKYVILNMGEIEGALRPEDCECFECLKRRSPSPR